MSSIVRLNVISFSIILGAIIGLGLWSWKTTISGAVIAKGTIVVESNVKTVQHAEGGIVKEIHVKDGDRVKAGDLLVRLDAKTVKATLEINRNQLDQLNGELARLIAERDNLKKVQSAENIKPDILKRQTRLFHVRRSNQNSHKKQLEEQIRQFEEEIIGLSAQKTAKRDELDIVLKELKAQKELQTRGLARVTRLNQLLRRKAQLNGEIGVSIASIARVRGLISERRVLITKASDEFLSKVLEQIEKVRSDIKTLKEKQITIRDQLNRLDVRSPIAGYIHQLDIHTIGAVVNSASKIANIVPEKDPLIVEARINPFDIDQIYQKQSVNVRFSSFNPQNTPELASYIKTVSPDLNQDPVTKSFYYTARIAFKKGELQKITDRPLVPGMPVDAFIKTRDRTVLSFLMAPLTDQIMRAFRED